MQPPTDAPPAPPPPPDVPPPGQPTAATFPGGAIPLEGLPTNTRELQGLRERREILRDQLERAQNRREETLGQLNNDGEGRLGPEARVGMQQRLTQLDGRILQIERDIEQTERLLSNAPPAVLAQAAQEERQQENRGNMVDEDEAVGAAFASFGAGVVLMLVIGRVRRRFARRRAAKMGVANPAAAATEDPRIDRLAQAVDAIAEEVERIGEGQRFVTQLLGQQQAATQPVALERERR